MSPRVGRIFFARIFLGWICLPLIPAGAQPRCQPKPLALKAQLSPNLGPGCRLSDFLPAAPGAEAWVDAYQIEIASPGSLSVRVSSDVFNAYVRVLRENRTVVAENDDAAASAE